MDKNQTIGGKSVVFILRGTPTDFRVEIITDCWDYTDIRGTDLTRFFGPEMLDHEDFKKNFTED